MNYNKTLLVIAALMPVFFLSCKDKDKDPVPKIEQPLIVGLWTVTETMTDTNANGSFEAGEEDEKRPDEITTCDFQESGDLIIIGQSRDMDSVLTKDTTYRKWVQSENGKQLFILGKAYNIDGTTRDTTYADIISLTKDEMVWEQNYTYVTIEHNTVQVKSKIILNK